MGQEPHCNGADLVIDLGGAVQVDPIKFTFKAPGPQRLKLEFDVLLSSFAFKFNLRRYTSVGRSAWATTGGGARFGGMGLHSSTSQLNLSRVGHINPPYTP